MIAVGVPLSAPVDESKDKPAGREGVIDQDVIAPPLFEGVTVVIAVSSVSYTHLTLPTKA